MSLRYILFVCILSILASCDQVGPGYATGEASIILLMEPDPQVSGIPEGGSIYFDAMDSEGELTWAISGGGESVSECQSNGACRVTFGAAGPRSLTIKSEIEGAPEELQDTLEVFFNVNRVQATGKTTSHSKASSAAQQGGSLFTASTGKLTLIEPYTQGVNGGAGLEYVADMAMSPDNQHLYAVSNSSVISLFSRNATDGKLTHVSDIAHAAMNSTARGVHVSPDGKHVYVTGLNTSNVSSLIVFERNASTGALNVLETHTLANCTGYGVDLSPDGTHVYVAGFHWSTGKLFSFSRNTTTGALQAVDTDPVINTNYVMSVTVSPDGQNVYAGYSDSSGLRVFSRNTSTGSLSLVETKTHASSGNALDTVSSIALTPNGQYLYTSGRSSSAVALFSRDAADNGKLTFVEAIQTAGALGAVTSSVVSASGKHLYTAAASDSAVSLFNINPTDGRLTYVEKIVEGGPDSGGFDPLMGAMVINLSPDNKHIYVGSEDGRSVVALSRE